MSLEEFGDGVVVEPVEENATSMNADQPEGIDSFDSDEVVELGDSQVNKLDDDDGSEKEKEALEKEDKAPEPKKVKEDDKKDGEERLEEESKKPEGKTLRLKDSNGDRLDIDASSTVKVKINGKNEFVSIEDLKSNYSGQVAYDEKFQDLEVRVRDAERNENQFKEERGEMVEKLEHIASLLDDEDGNPLDALYYLVDSTGRNALDFNKRVMDYLSDEVRNVDGMDDTERQLYWRNKEVDAIRSNQAANADRQKQSEAHREGIARVDQLRESHGVTEDQFIQSHEELVSLGHKAENITPEVIVNYSVMKPHYENSENICSDYEEDLGTSDYDALVDTVAATLKSYPRISERKALEVSLEQLGWDYEEDTAAAQRMNDKVSTRTDATAKTSYKYGQSGNDAVESFEDFE